MPNREIFPNWLRKSPHERKNCAPPSTFTALCCSDRPLRNFGKPLRMQQNVSTGFDPVFSLYPVACVSARRTSQRESKLSARLIQRSPFRHEDPKTRSRTKSRLPP